MKEKLLKIEAALAELPQKIKSIYSDFIKELYVIRHKMKDLSITNYELGLFHLNKGNIADAKMRFILATKLKKDFIPAHYHLARCYLFNLDFVKAKNELERAIALDSKLTAAQYRLSLINHNFENKAIPVEITIEDYNSLASKYEDIVLRQLQYVAPELLTKAIATYFKGQNIETSELKCLDLGCGTGLAGNALIQEITIKSLLGIDISIKMLELAKTLEINKSLVYTETKECDFHNLELIKDEFNIIMSCMSFGYANNVSGIFKKLNNISVKEAVLGLVVLKSESEEIEFNYDYACFSFSEVFLGKLFQEFNWSIERQEEIILFSNGTIGFMYILVKK